MCFDSKLYALNLSCYNGRAMKISVIVPVGNMEEWKVCEESLLASVALYSGNVVQ